MTRQDTGMMTISGRLRFDRGSLRLGLPKSARVPPYLTWDPRVLAWRTDQKTAVEAWEQAGGRGVVVKPTGTGKTEIALALITRHRASATS